MTAQRCGAITDLAARSQCQSACAVAPVVQPDSVGGGAAGALGESLRTLSRECQSCDSISPSC
eukprot:7095301-Prymnesium_polylepis.1